MCLFSLEIDNLLCESDWTIKVYKRLTLLDLFRCANARLSYTDRRASFR